VRCVRAVERGHAVDHHDDHTRHDDDNGYRGDECPGHDDDVCADLTRGFDHHDHALRVGDRRQHRYDHDHDHYDGADALGFDRHQFTGCSDVNNYDGRCFGDCSSIDECRVRLYRTRPLAESALHGRSRV
jgi:hypothetical protein